MNEFKSNRLLDHDRENDLSPGHKRSLWKLMAPSFCQLGQGFPWEWQNYKKLSSKTVHIWHTRTSKEFNALVAAGSTISREFWHLRVPDQKSAHTYIHVCMYVKSIAWKCSEPTKCQLVTVAANCFHLFCLYVNCVRHWRQFWKKRKKKVLTKRVNKI